MTLFLELLSAIGMIIGVIRTALSFYRWYQAEGRGMIQALA